MTGDRLHLDNSCGLAILHVYEVAYMKRRTGHLRAGTSDLTWGAEMWCMKACSTVIGSCLLTFLPTLRQLAMDIRWLSLFVLYRGSPHPFGSYSRFVPDGVISDAPSRTLPGVRSEQGPKLTACAVTGRPRGKHAVKSFRFLGEGVSTGLQT